MEQKQPEDGVRQTHDLQPVADATGAPVAEDHLSSSGQSTDSFGAVDSPSTATAAEGEQETFPRAYVEQLRQEAADARVKARRADDLAQQLFSARVAATGLLVDPADLPYDEQLLDDPGAMEAAIEALITAKPHLASRIPRGDIGQGVSDPADTVDLAALLRAGAN